MNRIKTFLLLMIAAAIHCNAANYLRVNQIGYLVDDVKVAVIMMEHGDAPTSFCVVNADSGKKTVMHTVKPTGEFAGFAQTARLDFSKVKTPGTYYITAAGRNPHLSESPTTPMPAHRRCR